MVTANNTATSNFSLTAADTTPPTITNIVPSPTWVIPDGTVTVTANVTDDKAISQGNINLLGANLLTNPSFESGMPGWINNSSPSYSVLSTGGYPSPGTAKVGGRWAASSSMNGGAPEISQVVNVTPGAKYFLSVWAYTDGSPNTCSSYLQWKDGAATAVNVDWFDNNTPSGGWKQLCGTVTPTSSQLTYILKLSWASNGGGNFDLAEVRLAPNPDTYANGIATWNNVIVPTSYAFQVYAKDDAGNESQVVSSTTVNIDSTVPDTPIVTDDGVYTADTSQLNANWTSSDSESGIAEYQYAIGNATGGTSIVDWTSIGTANTVTKTGLSLARDQIYYFSVKAKNGAGQWSSVGMSDGIVVASPVDSISEAKSYQDSSVVQLTNKPVSASTASTLWLEESNRSSGIRVNYSSAIQPGTSVTITGRMATSQSERFIDQAVVQQNGAVSIPKALALSNKQLGGSTLNLYTPGVKNGIGLNNIGLLVQVWGRVTQLGSGYFYIDDGSGLLDGSTTGILQNNGIRVLAAPDTSLPGDIVIVTGISTTFDLSDQHIRAVTPIIDGIKKIN